MVSFALGHKNSTLGVSSAYPVDGKYKEVLTSGTSVEEEKIVDVLKEVRAQTGRFNWD